MPMPTCEGICLLSDSGSDTLIFHCSSPQEPNEPYLVANPNLSTYDLTFRDLCLRLGSGVFALAWSSESVSEAGVGEAHQCITKNILTTNPQSE